jgi:hypothetical protein
MRGLAVEHEAALRLAGTEQRRTAGRATIRRLLEQANAKRFEEFLARQRLLGLVGTRAQEVAGDVLPASFFERVAAVVEESRRLALGQAAVTQRLWSALEAAGIRCVPVKGPGLAARAHGDPGLMSSRDIDLLVAGEQLEHAIEVVAQEGYRPAAQEIPATRPDLHVALAHPRGLPDLELHWRLHWYEDRFASSLLAAAEPDAADGRVAPPAYELAALLLFYARDGFAGLRLAATIAAWWDRYGGAVPNAGPERIANAHPELRGALAAAVVVAERTVGVPLATKIRPPARERSVLFAVRLANWDLRGDPDQVGANVALVDWLLAPRGGGSASARRRLVPGGRADLDRVLHPAKLVARFGIALSRLAGGRMWSPLPEDLF